MYLIRSSRLLLLLGLALLVSLPALAREEPTDDEVALRILELQRQIEELLLRLPPERREQMRKNLAGFVAPPDSVPDVPPDAVSTGPPPPAPPPPKPRRAGPNRIVCNTLEVFDTNEDGTIDALDRYWRHLYLWTDRNQNGEVEKREVVSTFAEKVKEIAADLDSFATFKRGRGEIRVGDQILLDLRGNGFDPERSRDDVVLLVDASALARGTGPALLSDTGQEIEGVQPFAKGWRLRDSEGRVTRLNCP